MNFAAIKTALHTWAVSVVAVETIFANQNGNKPENPYCTLLVQPVQFLGHDEYSIDTLGEITYIGQREISVSVQYFGTGAMQNAIDLSESLETFTAREGLQADGLVFVDRASAVNDLSEVEDTGFEERAGVDLLFRTCSERSQSGGLIENTVIIGEYDKQDGSPVIQRIETIGGSP